MMANLTPNRGMFTDSYLVYKNIKYGSILEVQLAKLLNKYSIPYEYNIPLRINDKNFSSDFKINGHIIEIDGIGSSRRCPLNDDNPKIVYYKSHNISFSIVSNIQEAIQIVSKITGTKISMNDIELGGEFYRNPPSKRELEHLHHNESMTLNAIANKFGYSRSTLKRHMANYGLEVYSFPELARKKVSPEVIRGMYCDNNNSIATIAQKLGVAESYIYKIMKQYDIPRRFPWQKSSKSF